MVCSIKTIVRSLKFDKSKKKFAQIQDIQFVMWEKTVVNIRGFDAEVSRVILKLTIGSILVMKLFAISDPNQPHGVWE